MVRIIHRKLHREDDQNGKCVEAAEEIMALLPADDYQISDRSYVLSLEDRIEQLEKQNEALCTSNEKYASKAV